ncbi:hypothetical protein C8Q74DRAFT_1372499 [Fomes fomentarius]|nr:hypothetical protein C8Q74DRAFT_1372499 [Fomes fomentarius]
MLPHPHSSTPAIPPPRHPTSTLSLTAHVLCCTPLLSTSPRPACPPPLFPQPVDLVDCDSGYGICSLRSVASGMESQDDVDELASGSSAPYSSGDSACRTSRTRTTRGECPADQPACTNDDTGAADELWGANGPPKKPGVKCRPTGWHRLEEAQVDV